MARRARDLSLQRALLGASLGTLPDPWAADLRLDASLQPNAGGADVTYELRDGSLVSKPSEEESSR